MAMKLWWQRWLAAAVVAAALAVWAGSSATGRPNEHALTVGEAANFDFTLKDMNGADVRLSDFRGRPIVLNFWATWCGPCREEIPALIALVDDYKEQKLAVLGVSVDDAPEALRKYAAEAHMNYPVLVGFGHDNLQEAYDAVMAIPITWLIGADGKVFLKHPGPASREWFQTQVKSLVATPPESE
jgi:peroxiredoxin